MLDIKMASQPDGVSCGPSCLNAIYHYYAASMPLGDVIQEVTSLKTGGTLAVFLGCHALQRGFKATLHSFNLHVLDPTWMLLSQVALLDKLRLQLNHTHDAKIKLATTAYITYLELGGQIIFNEINFDTLDHYLQNKIPLISGVSATYLYKNMRDYTDSQSQVFYDEWLGSPSGHFIILNGCDKQAREIQVVDPYFPNTLSTTADYRLSYSHWLHAFLLGVITYDAELLAIQAEAK